MPATLPASPSQQDAPSTVANLPGLPAALLHIILASAGDGGPASALACKSLSSSWKEVLTHPCLVARYLLSRYDFIAVRHIYSTGQQAWLHQEDGSDQLDAYLLKLLQELVRAGAEVDLHEALLLSQAARAGHCAVVLEILTSGAGRPTAYALSRAVTAAAEQGHRTVVRHLLAAGAPVSAYQGAALVAAASYGDPDTVYDICLAGADANADDGKALRRAVQLGHAEAAAVLLQHGADPAALCSAALLHACSLSSLTPPQSRKPEPAAATSGLSAPPAAKAPVPALRASAAPTTASMPQHSCLPSGGSGLSQRDLTGPSALMRSTSRPRDAEDQRIHDIAASSPSASTASAFASASPTSSPSSRMASSTSAADRSLRRTLLTPPSLRQRNKGEGLEDDDGVGQGEEGVLQLVMLLLRAGADARAHGRPALEASASRGLARVVRALLEAGADAAACNSCALVAASLQGHTEVAALLLEAGADPWDVSELALRTAWERGHRPVVQMIQETQRIAYSLEGFMMNSLDPGSSSLVGAARVTSGVGGGATPPWSRGGPPAGVPPALWRLFHTRSGSSDGPSLLHNGALASSDSLTTPPPQRGAQAPSALGSGPDPAATSTHGSVTPLQRMGSTAGRVGRPQRGMWLEGSMVDAFKSHV